MNNDVISRSAVLAGGNVRKVVEYDEAGYSMEYLAIPADVIEALPALDAVPVVRCKDCVHAAPLEGYASRKFEIGLNCRACRGDSGYGIAGLSFTTPDGYCDDGLRRAR